MANCFSSELINKSARIKSIRLTESAKVHSDCFSDYQISILINSEYFFHPRFIFKMQITILAAFYISQTNLSTRLRISLPYPLLGFSLIFPPGRVGSVKSLFRFFLPSCRSAFPFPYAGSATPLRAVRFGSPCQNSASALK